MIQQGLEVTDKLLYEKQTNKQTNKQKTNKRSRVFASGYVNISFFF